MELGSGTNWELGRPPLWGERYSRKTCTIEKKLIEGAMVLAPLTRFQKNLGLRH